KGGGHGRGTGLGKAADYTGALLIVPVPHMPPPLPPPRVRAIGGSRVSGDPAGASGARPPRVLMRPDATAHHPAQAPPARSAPAVASPPARLLQGQAPQG